MSSSTTGTPSPGSRLAIRSTSESRPKPVSTTVAPCSIAIRAVWKAIDASVITPVISTFLPSSSPVIVRHSLAWIEDLSWIGDGR